MPENDNYITKENTDGEFCKECKHRFENLEEQEKNCKECLFYLLQED